MSWSYRGNGPQCMQLLSECSSPGHSISAAISRDSSILIIGCQLDPVISTPAGPGSAQCVDMHSAPRGLRPWLPASQAPAGGGGLIWR